MQPINYSTNIANPFESALQGYQTGLGIMQQQQQQQQQEAALAQKQKQAQVIQSLIANPSAGGEDYANAMLQVPGMIEPLKQAWDMKSATAQKQLLSDLSQWGAALQNKQPQIVVDGLNKRADAIENATNGPTDESRALRAKAQAVKENPAFGTVLINSMLTAHSQGKAVIDNIVALDKNARDQTESDSKVTGEKIDQRIKNLGIVAQKAGALAQAKGGVAPSQAQTFFRTMTAQGFLPKEELQDYLDGIPADPAAVPGYLRQVQAAGMKPDDQMKFTTPTADAQLQAQSSRYSTDSAARTAANRLAFDREQAADSPAAPVGTPGSQGQQYLASLDKPTADQVRALAEGRLGFPIGKALQSPYWQKMITAVAQYDPSFDAVNYNARAKARADLTSGKTGSNIKAINTAIAHMGQLNAQMTALGNTRFEGYNKFINWAANQVGYEGKQSKVAAVEATAEGVAGEMAKVFRDTGMSAHEIETWREKFKASTTPAAQKGTMQSGMHMLQGRMEAIEDQYHQAMGTTAQPLRILTPESQKIFDGVLGKKPAPKPAPASPSGPAVGAIESGKDGVRYRFKGGDPSQSASWERVR